jgi:outer membrane protein OmpA-like peptidoglycan-associated protein
MHHFNKTLLILSFVLSFLNLTYAQTYSQSNSVEKFYPQHWGLSGFAGYLRSATDLGFETSKNGAMGGGKGFLSWDIQPDHRIDLGLGFNLNFAKGDDVNFIQSITQLSALTDLSYYYTLNPLVALGAIWHNEIGAGAHLDFSDLKSVQWWSGIGPSIKFALKVSDLDFEAGASVLADFTVPNRTQFKVPFFVSFRFPMKYDSTIVRVSESDPLVNYDIAPGFVAEIITPDHVKITLPPSRVLFALADSDVQSLGINYLTRVADLVKSYDKALKTVSVVGHADRRGDESFNQSLSESRAESVGKILQSNGVAADRIQTQGLGSTQLRFDQDNEDAHTANRRVEITIEATGQAMALAGELNQLDKELIK